MTSLTEYERQQLAAIEAWKNERPGAIRRAMEVLVAPIEWVLDKVIPDYAIDGALDAASRLAQRMTDTEDVLRAAQLSELRSMRNKELKECDKLADGVHTWAVGMAALEGSAAGAFGILSAPIDLPVTVTLAMRTIHKIGVCYGYGCETKEDERFVRSILGAAGASTQEEKLLALGMLSTMRAVLVKQTCRALVKGMTGRRLIHGLGPMTAIHAARRIGLCLIRRRALAAIPVVGVTVGGAANGFYLNAVGWAARRSFQERWLADSGKLTPEQPAAEQPTAEQPTAEQPTAEPLTP